MFESNYQMSIGGQMMTGQDSFDVINPARGDAFASAPNCSRAELDECVSAARSAFASWRKTSLDDRRKLVRALAQAMTENAEQLARLLTREQGKPFADAMADIMGGAYWLAETMNLDLPEHISEDTSDRKAITRYEPLGVVAAIAPWNFPILLAMFKVAPALLAGNTVVLKPAPTTPLTTLKIGELAQAIFPAGVLNVISGDDRLGPWLTAHDGIDKISFTGSTEVGKKVMAGAAKSLKRITLELGGNDAAIVMPDVDVDIAAEHLFWAAFKNAGQICIAAKRMYVHEDIYDPLKDALVNYAKTVKVGDGSEQGTLIGPVQNSAQYNRVMDLIETSKKDGIEFLTGEEDVPADGYFIPVSILDNPPKTARIVQEEQFGPVLPLIKFADLDDVIEDANDSEYGLGATVWSGDLELAEQIAGKLQAGTVWINETQYLSPHAPFAGQKQSGMGVEGALEGLLEFTQSKTIFISKKNDLRASN